MMNLFSGFSNVFVRSNSMNYRPINYISKNDICNEEVSINKINDILYRIEKLFVNDNDTYITKIKTKLNLIRKMQEVSFPSYRQSDIDNIVFHLHYLECELDKYLHSKMLKLNTILGAMLHNIYQTSGYNIILSNIPEYAESNDTISNIDITTDNELIQVDSESIYDTLIQYVPSNEILLVVQISYSRYLIKIASDDIAKSLCNLLHKKQIGNNIINMEFIESIPTKPTIQNNNVEQEITKFQDNKNIFFSKSYQVIQNRIANLLFSIRHYFLTIYNRLQRTVNN